MPKVKFKHPLKDIADDIADKYHRRRFPGTKLLKNGLLDYRTIHKEPLVKELHRPTHGYTNSIIVAGLVAEFLKLYRMHRDEFPEELQQEMDEITDDRLKKIQIVGLMRPTGRTKDSDSGYKFC